ncbi:PAS domain S-box protein [Scytonema tolypothrichoides VB-61278]|nr:PAS domain S-box protein [Scytonema tolypothrichoides VB-61278]
MQRPQSEITLDDILITEELSRRSPRPSNLQAENQALHTLARQLVNQPEIMLQSLVDIALELCNAGTAGVSLLEVLPSGEEIFRWNVLAGTLEQYVGGSTPRNFSPCGVCLERGAPVLFSHPERYFTYFQEAKTPVVEGLVLPLIADNHALGTIWIMSHDEQRHFDAEDVRVMTSLADFTAAALLLNQRQTQELLAKNAQLEALVVERQRAEESARESEAYFRAIVNLVPDLLWRNDTTGDTSWYNQRWLDYTGQTMEEAQGYGWLEVIHPDDRALRLRSGQAQSLANFQNAVDEHRPLRQEHRIRGTDGNYRWFLIQASPVYDAQGRIIQWFGAATDIHEQRTALETLRESEERLRLAADAANFGTYEYTAQTDQINWSITLKSIHGLPEDAEITFDRLSEFIHPDDQEQTFSQMRQFLSPDAPGPYELEFRIVRTDGAVRWLLDKGRVFFTGEGEHRKADRAIGVTLDITDRKLSEVALRESEERLQVMIENLPGGAAFVVDRNLRYLLAEGEALAIAGFKPENFVGRTIFEVLPPELAAYYEPIYRQALAGELFEHEHNAHDRSYVSRGTPLRSPNGEVYAVLAVSYDITDRKKAEESLRESEERLRLATEAADMYAWEFDLRTSVPKFSQNVERVTGNLLTDNFEENLEQVHPDDRAIVRQAFEDALINGDRFDYEMRTFTRDHQMQWFLVSGVLIRDAQNVPVRAIGISQNITARKRAEEALRESEEKFRTFVSAASDIIYEMSADWREMLFLKGKAFVTTTENPRRDWTEAYIPETDKPQVWAAINRAIATRSNFELEHRVIRLDGTVGWTFSRAIGLINETGEIVKWFGAASDITEQKQAEVALRASEAKYRTLFNSIDEGFCIIERVEGEPIDFRYIEANPAFAVQTGISDVVGKTIREAFPDAPEAGYEIYENVLKTGEPIRFKIDVPSIKRILEIYAFRTEDEPRLAVIFNDITERKRAEKRQAFLLSLADRLRPIADPVEIMVAASEALGHHLGVGRCGYGEVDATGAFLIIERDWTDGIMASLRGTLCLDDFGSESELIAAYRAGRTVILNDALADARTRGVEDAFDAIGGLRASLAVPLLKEGRWVSVFYVQQTLPRQWTPDEEALVREVAERTWAAVERARAEAALRESEIQRFREQSAREQERQRVEALAELDRTKTLFFSNVSHEFRTPLTLLLAPLQDALSDRTHPLAPPHRERLELAHRNAIRLLKLVNTLLDFSRIEAGRMEAVYEATDLALLTTELASVFRSAIERAGLRLIVDCPPLPEPVYVDREMWEKIVLNLLSNAFKFTLEGEIAVRLYPADDHHVRLQVQDTGTGIPPEELPHLFERFYQVRGAKARTHEGSGIGLALVHELIRLNGGTVDVSSTVVQGTCFTVTIPLGTAHLPNDRIEVARTLVSTAFGAAPYVEEAERWLPEEDERREGGKLSFTPSLPHSLTPSLPHSHTPTLPHSPSAARVLLVDDNADIRYYLTRILSEHVQVEAVADGAAALAAAQERVPDLVLSDVMMPQLDGFELLKALRADVRTREVPIILLSARAGEDSVIEGLQAGADDYLIKPFSATELVTRVLAHLQMAQLRLEALRQERTISRRKDEMLSTVSHELNTPLVAILGWTRLLRANPPSHSMLMKSLETIERNATLQAKLISDLLDISRITAGKLRLNLEPVELQSVIEMAIACGRATLNATVHQTQQTKDIELSSLLNPLPIIIQGDPDRLQQIVLNLLTNAIKFTPKGGRIEVRLNANQTHAQILVSDTGCGIAAEFLPYVFDSFRQAESSTSTKGLGLGLAIARHLVELHGGSIYAESPGIGQGATFTVTLPLIGANL